MKLFEQVAQPLVEQASSLLGISLSITDEKGIIIGSDNKGRIGTLHPVSSRVIEEGREVVFTKEQVDNMENVLPGIAAPICFNHKVIGVLGIVGEPESVRKYVKFIHSHIEMFLRESFRTESELVQMKTTELFVQHLIHYEDWKDTSKLEEYCQLLGVHFNRLRVCLLIHFPVLQESSSQAEPLQTQLQSLIGYLFRESNEDIVCPVNQEQWVVFKIIDSKGEPKLRRTCESAIGKLTAFLDREGVHGRVTIAYGKSYMGLEGAARSYQQAQKAIMAGLRSDSEESVYSFDSWSILPDIFLEDIDLRFLELFADDIRNIWEFPESDMLIETFIAYCESSMNVSKAARNLYIHRNTLMYRLNKISELSRIDPQSFEQCIVLYIALKKKERNPLFMKVSGKNY
ncbi:CdaR family transcriptional regulator [Siminovitchia terrae]|uniref:CdaR family transcriptional regulator n=1 Tax=Siminovitchia terrae TaxID=1914933 RepID=A0ABQ4KZW2_SIMTE|nr:sugar diacid recognition domain-containing protein [Siminovitchia terrae]GIN97490.1 CdaR family transcriptional regulator [Siminovitchia terrae]